MLLQLSIRDIALIDQLTLSFADRNQCVTGETGAGKSIIVGSLDFVLGGKADRDRIAGGAERGRAEALFDISALPRVQSALTEMGLETEDGLLPVCREILQSGRSVCRVAGEVVTVAQLRAVMAPLIDLHGQHAHQSLLDPAKHLQFLDALGDAEHRAATERVRALYGEWSAIARALREIETNDRERARREDMLRFQLEELDGAKLRAGEEDELTRQRALMRNAEKIRSGLEEAYGALSGDETGELPGALDALQQAAKALGGLSKYDGRFEALSVQLNDAMYAAESVAGELDGLREECGVDPRRLEQVESRLDQLDRLRRKYGATTVEMIAFRERVRAELDSTASSEEKREALKKQEKAAKAAFMKEAQALSEARRALAKACEGRVAAQLAALEMKSAVFEVAFSEDAAPSADGLDAVEFRLSANRGEPPRPLQKAASGGELSRVMLALKCVEAENDGVPTLVFDEIDTGVGGATGVAIAEKLREVGAKRQVLCVTHLPQIAAAARTQFWVEKSVRDGRTHTDARELDTDGRVEAVAQMLGGGETARAHARAMIER